MRLSKILLSPLQCKSRLNFFLRRNIFPERKSRFSHTSCLSAPRNIRFRPENKHRPKQCSAISSCRFFEAQAFSLPEIPFPQQSLLLCFQQIHLPSAQESGFQHPSKPRRFLLLFPLSLQSPLPQLPLFFLQFSLR